MTTSHLVALTLTTGLAASASAAVQTYNIAAGDLAPGKPQFSQPHGTGSNPFAFDWDSAAPIDSSIGSGGPASGSLYANVQGSGATPSDRYRSFRIGTRDLAGVPGGTLDLNELTGITYDTNKPGAKTAIDWRVTIYTVPTGSGDAAGWYKTRIQSFPQESLLLDAPSNQWNTWTTEDGAANELVWEGNNGLSNTYDWAALLAAKGNEEIMMIDLTFGANSGGGTGESYLDNVRLNFAGGNGVVVNLVPEPASLALLAMGAGVALLRRRRTV